jgi:hypothetical protein
LTHPWGKLQQHQEQTQQTGLQKELNLQTPFILYLHLFHKLPGIHAHNNVERSVNS